MKPIQSRYAEKVKFDTADVFGAIEDQDNPNKEDLLDVSLACFHCEH